MLVEEFECRHGFGRPFRRRLKKFEVSQTRGERRAEFSHHHWQNAQSFSVQFVSMRLFGGSPTFLNLRFEAEESYIAQCSQTF